MVQYILLYIIKLYAYVFNSPRRECLFFFKESQPGVTAHLWGHRGS